MKFFACIEMHLLVTAPRLASVATVDTATVSVATVDTATNAQRRICGRLLTGS